MKNLFGLLLCMGICFFQFTLYSQQTYTISGKIFDEAGHSLPGASIVIIPGNMGMVSNSNGQFALPAMKPGNYELIVSFIGYEEFHQQINVQSNVVLNITLSSATLSLQEVVVACHHDDQRKKEESLNIEIVNDDYLKQNLGGSLMSSLERLPGVSSIDIGSGQSKPVIRGLGFNRVMVVENNIKHEAQQWGADHGLEIDQYAVDNIEVVKGPASLKYGSDAIGGIIDMKNKSIPAENTIGGTIDLSGKTNNNFLGSSLSLYGRKAWFYAQLRATFLDYADYKIPTDSVDIYSYRAALYKNHLRNTAGKEQNLHVSFGIIQKQFQSRFYLSSVHGKSGFFANAHGLEPRNVNTDLHDASNRDIQYPYQTVTHIKATNSSSYQWTKTELELVLGFQQNLRHERSEYVQHGYMPAVFPDTMDYDSNLDRGFNKHVYTANMKLNYQINTLTQIDLGINTEYQKNRIDGHGFIIPAYQQVSSGAFLVAKHMFSDESNLQLGIRYDYGHINIEKYSDWYASPVMDENGDTTFFNLLRAADLKRSFSSFSWSIGYNYHPDHWLVKINLGKGFRMPIAKELAANGVNYHRFSFEVGDAELAPEQSYQLDLGIEYSSKRFAIGASPFVNYFSNYIYLNPTSEHDRLYGNGNQVFYYTESEVFRYGSEIHAHYELVKNLQCGVIGEYVYSEQLSGAKKGFTLPFSPPASGILNLKFQKHKVFNVFENAYLSVDYRVTAAQNNIVPPEVKTKGYQVVNAGMGGDVFWKKQKINITMQVQNLFNTKYFNHTSYYRLINVPEAGRNFIINISLPFSGKI